MNQKKIAIMGARGHVATNIYWQLRDNNEIYQFSREQIEDPQGGYLVYPYSDFFNYDYDLIINCVGFGNPEEIETAGVQLFLVTEEYDNKVLSYLNEHPNTRYIFISSGAVHNQFFVDDLQKKNFYQISKINAEAKHRSLPALNIVDIRLYSFFTRFTNLDSKFFMSALIKAILTKTVFVTNEREMIRDYINPKDLINLIELSLKPKHLNEGFDIYSLSPISKFEILRYFQDKCRLKVKFDNRYKSFSSVGKDIYASTFKRKAAILGYKPKYTSLKTIKEESACLL
jgi:nucleoside-diphosphate-sugar epimerase